MKHDAFVLALAMFSFVMTVIWGTPLLRVLRHFRIGKLIRVDEPGHHNVKMGTPTMGGVLFILPVLLLTGLLNAANLIGFDAIGSPAVSQTPRFQGVQDIRQPHADTYTNRGRGGKEIKHKSNTIADDIEGDPDEVSGQKPEQDQTGHRTAFNRLENHIPDRRDNQDLQSAADE